MKKNIISKILILLFLIVLLPLSINLSKKTNFELVFSTHYETDSIYSGFNFYFTKKNSSPFSAYFT